MKFHSLFFSLFFSLFIGFWLFIPIDYSLNQKTKRLHLISRVSEISDFNYVDLLEGNSVKSTVTDSIHCCPQIILRENNEKKIIIEVNMSVSDTTSLPLLPKNVFRSFPKKKRPANKIVLISSNFPINSWIHCVVQSEEFMDRKELNKSDHNDDNEVSNDKNCKNENVTKNKLLRGVEKTIISLYFDGKLIASDSAVGGRPSVYQSVIIGTIPTQLASRNPNNDYFCSNNIDCDYDDNNSKSDNDDNNCKKNVANDNLLALDSSITNDNHIWNSGSSSSSPLIADVYWTSTSSKAGLPSAPQLSQTKSNPLGVTSEIKENFKLENNQYKSIKNMKVNGADKFDKSSFVGIQCENLGPPSGMFSKLQNSLATAVLVLEVETSLLIARIHSEKSSSTSFSTSGVTSSLFSETELNSSASLSNNFATSFVKEVESVLFLSLDILTCGNNDATIRTFQIIFKLISHFKYLTKCSYNINPDMNNSGKNEKESNVIGHENYSNQEKNGKNRENVSIFDDVRNILNEYFECLIFLVFILTDQEHIFYLPISISSRLDPSSDMKVNKTEDETVSFSDKINRVIQIFADREYVHSKDIIKQVRASNHSLLTSIDTNSFLYNVSCIFISAFSSHMILSNFFDEEKSEIKFPNTTTVFDESLFIRRKKNKKIFVTKQLLLSMCCGGGLSVSSCPSSSFTSSLQSQSQSHSHLHSDPSHDVLSQLSQLSHQSQYSNSHQYSGIILGNYPHFPYPCSSLTRSTTNSINDSHDRNKMNLLGIKGSGLLEVDYLRIKMGFDLECVGSCVKTMREGCMLLGFDEMIIAYDGRNDMNNSNTIGNDNNDTNIKSLNINNGDHKNNENYEGNKTEEGKGKEKERERGVKKQKKKIENLSNNFNFPNIENVISIFRKIMTSNELKSTDRDKNGSENKFENIDMRNENKMKVNKNKEPKIEGEVCKNNGHKDEGLEGDESSSDLLFNLSLHLSQLKCLSVQTNISQNKEKELLFNEDFLADFFMPSSSSLSSSSSSSSSSSLFNSKDFRHSTTTLSDEGIASHNIQRRILSQILKKNIPSLLSLASSNPVLSVLTVLGRDIIRRENDVMSVIESIMLEGNVRFIEEMYLQLWKVVRHYDGTDDNKNSNSNNYNNSNIHTNDDSISDEKSKNILLHASSAISNLSPIPPVTIPVQAPTSTSTSPSATATATATGMVRSRQIDWYSGVKGEPSCPIIILGGDVQITDGTKVRASLHFSSIASTPLTAINLDQMKGRWFYEVRLDFQI